MSEQNTQPVTAPAVASSDLLADWPKTPNGNYLCAPGRPMPKGAPGRWEHTSCHEVGDQEDGWPGGDIVTIRCDDCGKTWREELPQ